MSKYIWHPSSTKMGIRRHKTVAVWPQWDKYKHLLVGEAVFGDLVTCKTSLDNPRTLKERDKTLRLITTCYAWTWLELQLLFFFFFFWAVCVFERKGEVMRHSLKPPAVSRLAASRNIVPHITSLSTDTLSWTVTSLYKKQQIKEITARCVKVSAAFFSNLWLYLDKRGGGWGANL